MEEEVLLRREHPANVHVGDVEHWISVYRELLNVNRRLLNQMQNHGDAEMEAQPVEQHIQRLEARLAFWTERRR